MPSKFFDPRAITAADGPSPDGSSYDGLERRPLPTGTVMIDHAIDELPSVPNKPDAQVAALTVILASTTHGPITFVLPSDNAVFVLGRDETASDGLVADPRASRRHAAIRRNGLTCSIEDLGSTNGTFVNTARIGTAVLLRDGDEIRIGRTRFRYSLE